MSRNMHYLLIVGLKDDLIPTIHVLGELGCMDIEQPSLIPDIEVPRLIVDPALVREHEELNKRLFRVNSLIEALGVNKDLDSEDAPTEQASLHTRLEELNTLSTTVQGLIRRRDSLQAEQEILPRFLTTVRKLMPLFPDTVHDPTAVSFGLLIDRDHAEILDVLANHVDETTQGEAQAITGSIDEATLAMLIVVPGQYAESISAVLDEHDVSRLRLPPEFETRSLEDAIASLEARIQGIAGERQSIEADIQTLSKQWSVTLLAYRTVLMNELETHTVLSQLGQTQMTFVLTGWVPAGNLKQTKGTLAQRIGENLIIADLPMSEELEKHAPVILNNPTVAQPFESLVNLFSTPKYGEYDPTMSMAVFMPMFFGMMLGDIGYGILLLLIAWWVRRRTTPGTLQDILTILGLGSVWAVVFGVLYGELFGAMGESIGLHPVLFDRADPAHLLDLLALSIAAGAIHLTLGLLLGIWEGIRTRSRHHLLERVGRLFGLIALFMLAGLFVDFLPPGFMTPATALLVVGTVLLAASVGRIGVLLAPIEMIGLVGNVLSYLRIAAIGLSSVYLALVAGEIAGVIGSIIVGGLIAVLLHALNLALGSFSPTIQSLRLHYVEFFRNFYVGGGRLYKPFRLPAQPHD